MERPIAYSGNKPYIFVSYAHADNARVWPIIQTLQNHGFRVWYDNGIDPGTEWDKIIAEHLVSCTLFLVIMSKAYLASDNCKDELSYSRDLNKNRVIVHLEEVVLPPELAMRIGRSQALFYYMYNQSNMGVFYDNLQKATGMMSCYERPVYAGTPPYTANAPYVAPVQQSPYVAPVPQQPIPQQQNVQQAPVSANEEKIVGTKPVYGKGIPGFRSKRPWKRAVAIIGYLQILGTFFLVRDMFSRVPLPGVGIFIPLFTCLYILSIVFVSVDFLCINEIFSFATTSKKGRAAAKIIEIAIFTILFLVAFFVTVMVASATDLYS